MVPFDSERSGLPRREPMPGIKRCQFITLLGGATALIGSLLGTQAQQRPLPVVGILHPNSRDAGPAYVAALLEGLKAGM